MDLFILYIFVGLFVSALNLMIQKHTYRNFFLKVFFMTLFWPAVIAAYLPDNRRRSTFYR